MAQQTINIGTTANDGTGDPIRSAFDKSNDNFTELYGAGALSIASDILTYTKADGTTSTVDLSPYLDEDARAIASGTIDGAGIVTFTRDDATTFTLDLSSLLDDTNLVTSVNTQVGAVVLDSDDIAEGSTNLYNQTHTGDVTGSTALTIADNVVSYEKIDDEFSTSDALTAAATVDIDFDAAQIFTLTPTSSTTLNITNPKVGITKTLIVTGAGSSYTLSFTVGGASGTFNLIAGEYDDTSSTKNLIQIICVSATEFWYSISQIAS